MVYHLTCWKQKYPESKSAGFPTKYENTHCGECGKPIAKGELITWPRRFKGGKATFKTETEQAIEVEEAEEKEVAEAEREMAKAETAATPTPALKADSVADAIANLVMPVLEARLEAAISKVDTKTMVAEIVAAAEAKLANVAVRTVEVKRFDGTTANIGVQHKQFETLLKYVSARVNVWLCGPAGSGKTTAAHNVATALDLKFRYSGSIADGYALTGYCDAHGKYVRTLFREAWEHGGVFLLDDFDSSDPNAVLTLMAALANGHAAFPDGVIPKHEDCVIILAANTWGQGATHEYVGRMKQDAAFLDRFAYLVWEYDENLERATCGNPEWCDEVIAMRQRVQARGIKVLITPRASYMGAKLLAAGLSKSEVREAVLRKGMTKDQWASVQ